MAPVTFTQTLLLAVKIKQEIVVARLLRRLIRFLKRLFAEAFSAGSPLKLERPKHSWMLGQMIESGSFLQDLEEAVSRGSAESRLRALWHATDLLIAGRYTEDEIWIFGEVIGRLAEEIEVAARAQLAKRLLRTDNASINLVKKLAFDNSIEVAGPMLQHSTRLDAKPAESPAE